MNARIVELDASIHQKVQKLLPWAVLGKLSEEEQALVSGHTAACAQCREDLDWQRRLQAVQPEAGASPDMESALARLAPQLEARPAANDGRWMRWALAAQLLVIAGLGAGLAAQLLRQPDEYRLLGAVHVAGAPSANIIVVFKPETSERTLRTTLQANAARIIDGPTAANGWLIKVPATSLDTALSTLRADPAVQLAEPLQAAPEK
jgi:hypothetical protein